MASKQNPLSGAFRTPGDVQPGGGKIINIPASGNAGKRPQEVMLPLNGIYEPGSGKIISTPASVNAGQSPLEAMLLPNGKYEITSGLHRLTAAKKLGLTEISISVKNGLGGASPITVPIADLQVKDDAEKAAPLANVGNATPGKPGEKAAEQPNPPAEVKNAAPGKSGEKAAEQPNPPAEAKNTAPGKPGEKAVEPSKPLAEAKNATPGKPGEKAAEPPKPPTNAENTTPGKPGQKSAEPSKASADAQNDNSSKSGNGTNDELEDFTMQIVADDDSEKIVILPINLIDTFENHPFTVIKDDAPMMELVDSIQKVGLLEAVVVIPSEKNPGRYEMVAGHRRLCACLLAGFTNIRCVIRNMDRDTATIYMVDSNIRRPDVTPIIRAKAIAMKLEAMKRKAGRRSKEDIKNGAVTGRSDDLVAKEYGFKNKNELRDFIKTPNLVPEFQQQFNEGKLLASTAAVIADLKPDEQRVLADNIEKQGGKMPTGAQVGKLREESKAGTLTTAKIEQAVGPTKREENPPLKVTFADDELRSYFPDVHTTVAQVKTDVFNGLSLLKKTRERQAEKAAAAKQSSPPSR